MAAPLVKRSRVSRQENVKTTLFVIGHATYQGTVLLPERSQRLSISTVKQAIRQQTNTKPLPSLPHGYFSVIADVAGHQVAVFRYDKTVGCRDTNTAQHGRLPLPVRRHKSSTDLTYTPSLRVGHLYLYGYDHDYSVANGEIHLKHCLPPRVERRSENERTSILTSHLQKHYKCLDIFSFRNNYSHFCPFAGGGNITIFSKMTSSATILAGGDGDGDGGDGGDGDGDGDVDGDGDGDDQDATSQLNITPPSQGEYRCGSLENKVTGQQTEDQVRLQLQANMILTCSMLLERKLKATMTEAELESIGTLTCYGMMMGQTYALKLLKLTIDFKRDTTQFEELFSLDPCSLYPAYVDMVIEYIFHSL